MFLFCFLKNNAQDLYSVVVAVKLFNFSFFSERDDERDALSACDITAYTKCHYYSNLIFFFWALASKCKQVNESHSEFIFAGRSNMGLVYDG